MSDDQGNTSPACKGPLSRGSHRQEAWGAMLARNSGFQEKNPPPTLPLVPPLSLESSENKVCSQIEIKRGTTEPSSARGEET